MSDATKPKGKSELENLLGRRKAATSASGLSTPSDASSFAFLLSDASVSGGVPDVVRTGGGSTGELNITTSLKSTKEVVSSSTKGETLASPKDATFYSIVYISDEDVTEGRCCGGSINSKTAPGFCLKSTVGTDRCTFASHKEQKHLDFKENSFYLGIGSVSGVFTRVLHPGQFNLTVNADDADLLDTATYVMNDMNQKLENHSLPVRIAAQVFNEFVEIVEAKHATKQFKAAQEETPSNAPPEAKTSVTMEDTQDGKSVMQAVLNSVRLLTNRVESLELENVTLNRKLTALEVETGQLRKIATDMTTVELTTIFNRLDTLERGSNDVHDAHDLSFGDEEPVRLRADVDDLLYKFELIESRSKSQAITFSDNEELTLLSPKDALLFVNDHVSSSSFECFVDMFALIDISATSPIDDEDFISTQHSSSKSGFISVNEAKIGASLNRSTPRSFCTKASHAAATDSIGSVDRRFPLVKVRSYWVNRGGVEGIKSQLVKSVNREVAKVNSQMSHSLRNKGYTLAAKYLSESHQCFNDFVTWSEAFYIQLMGMSEVTEKEAWELILECWAAFFDDLTDVRGKAGARGVTGLERHCDERKQVVSNVIWCLGQSIMVQNSYREKGFQKHPSIANVINYHLFTNRVPTSVFEKKHSETIAKIDSINTWKGKANRDIITLKNKAGLKASTDE